MNLLWIVIVIMGIMRFGAALAAHYNFEHHAITIISNCLIPVLALLLVCLFNELERFYKWLFSMVDDDK